MDRLTVKALLRVLDLDTPADSGSLLRQLSSKLIRLTIRVERGGVEDEITVACLPLEYSDELVERLGLVITIGSLKCVVVPPYLLEKLSGQPHSDP